MRHLWIIRHAKSSWADPGQRDFERGLNRRGQRNGERMQEYLATLADPPTWLWSSTAKRAQLTAQYVRRGFNIGKDHGQSLDELYHADAYTLLDVLQRTPDAYSGVAIVGHNPGLTDLVNALAGMRVTDNLPTFGVAHFTFGSPAASGQAQSFRDLAFGRASFEALFTPKTIDPEPRG